jgi:hypothetical protein
MEGRAAAATAEAAEAAATGQRHRATGAEGEEASCYERRQA